MRWFTRAWQDGELTEAEAAAREGAYLEYVRSIEAHVAPHVRAFAAPTDDHASVDDALVDRIEIDHETSRIHLRLLNGNLQAGQGKLDLEFLSASVVAPALHELVAILRTTRTEFLRQEIELLEEGRLEVSFLLWPDGELVIDCSGLIVSWHPIDDATRTDHRNEVIVRG